MTGTAVATADLAPAMRIGAVDESRLVWESLLVVQEAAAAQSAAVPNSIDSESRGWLDRLASAGPSRDEAVEALFGLLNRAAAHEAGRRRGSVPAHVVRELDDLARQAAADAMVAVLRKLPEYRGASRFTTWAYKFAVFEVSSALRREAWRGRSINIADGSWERLTDLAPVDPAAESEGQELLEAILRSITTRLTVRQREVLVAVTILHVPVDVLAERRATTRGAIYKVLHDARRNLRQVLEAEGWRLDDRPRWGS